MSSERVTRSRSGGAERRSRPRRSAEAARMKLRFSYDENAGFETEELESSPNTRNSKRRRLVKAVQLDDKENKNEKSHHRTTLGTIKENSPERSRGTVSDSGRRYPTRRRRFIRESDSDFLASMYRFPIPCLCSIVAQCSHSL